MSLSRVRNPFRTGSLSARLFLIGLSTTLLSVLLTAGGLIAFQASQLPGVLESQMKAVADVQALNNTAPLRFGDTQVAAENLSSLKADGNVLRACLYDRDTSLFAAYIKPGTRKSCPPKAPPTRGLIVRQDSADYLAPVLLDGDAHCVILLCRDLRYIRTNVLSSLKILAAILTAVLLFALWVSLSMTRAIARPVAALVRTSRQVSEKRDYSLRVDWKSSRDEGELGLLINSFNDMLSQVEKSNLELDAHRGHLEEQVNNRTVELVCLNRDLTDELSARSAAESALRESEERYALAMNGANDGLWDWNLKTGAVYFSSRWKTMLGYDEGEIGDQPEEWLDRAHPSDAPGLRDGIEAHWLGRTPEFRVECRMLHKDGSYRWMLNRGLATRDAGNHVTRMAGSQTDITEAKVSDPLTGLANRILFTDRLARCVDLQQRDPEKRFGILFLDLDRFKVVNDSLGHLVGDQLLVGIAQRLIVTLRDAEMTTPSLGPCTVARLGGDEFAILLENVPTVESARHVAERIQRDIAVPFHLDGRMVFSSVSIGVAISSGEYCSAEELLRDADTAMYAAKGSGHSRHAVFDAAMRTRAVARLEIETDLRRSLADSALVLHYQPQVALQTGDLIGFEALVRWLHPKRGLISPAEFIPAAEETGFIVDLGKWVLDEACRQLRRWHSEFPQFDRLKVAVNISGRQFAAGDLVPAVHGALRTSGLHPALLDLEVTETVLMNDSENNIRTLLDLKRLGIGLQIDDFGTGYSSLSYLHRLPFDTLKIDRSFVASIGLQEDALKIVRTIMALAQSLRMAVVAEGVENRLQATHLRDMGCNFGQGFFFSRPLDAAAVSRLLAESTPQSHLPPQHVTANGLHSNGFELTHATL